MSRRVAYQTFALLGLLTAATLSGCHHDAVGTLNLEIAGVPSPDVQNVFLAIKGVEVGGDGGQTDLAFGNEILLDIEDGHSSLVDSFIPEGDYKWVRIDIDPAESYVIASNGDRYPLDIPSVYQSTADFTMGEGLTDNLLVDIDLRVALSSETRGGVTSYTLQQLSRLVDLDAVTNITGTVSGSLMVGGLSVTDPDCDPQVYIYQGEGAIPEGFFVRVKGGTPPFVSSTSITLRVTQDLYTYTVALLPPGTYTAAVSCAAADIPGSHSIAFSPTQTVVMTLAGNSVVTF